MLKDYNEEQLAKFFLHNVKELKENNFLTSGIPYFFEKYPNINFEKLQQECEKLGFHIKQGNQIKSKRKYYLQQWNKYQRVFIFLVNENSL